MSKSAMQPPVKGALLGATLILGLAILADCRTAAAAENMTPHRAPPAATRVYPSPSAWCVHYRLGALPSAKRLEGANLQRLQAAEAELAPGFEPNGAKTGLHLLASYQDELEKRHPNATVAATYLAMVSTVPITIARVQRVNALLCISTTRSHAQAISAEAEAERQQFAR